MNRDLREKLVCPKDRAQLRLVSEDAGTVIHSGHLICSVHPLHRYPIEDGIPDFREVAPDHFAATEDGSYGTRVTRALARKLARLSGDWSLDAGCGRGAYLPFLPGRYVGIDIIRPFLLDAKERWPNADFVAGDVSALPFADSTFNVVASSQVIEHLSSEDVRRVIDELRRVASGVVMLDTPNESPVLSALRLLVYREPAAGKQRAGSPLAHQTALSPRQLRSLGFAVEGCIGYVTRERFPAEMVWNLYDRVAASFPGVGGNLIAISGAAQQSQK